MDELLRIDNALQIEEHKKMEIKKNLISNAVKKEDNLLEIDDTKLVEAMFDFLPDSNNETPVLIRGTSALMV